MMMLKSVLCAIVSAVLVVFMVEANNDYHHPQPPPANYHHESYPSHYSPYSYGYDIEDAYGNKQWRQEKSVNPHEVHGSYGYKDKQGIYREVVYTADKNGFRAHVKTNEPGTSPKDPAHVRMDSHPVPVIYHKPHPYSAMNNYAPVARS